jgi:hypothetical protein
LNAIALKRIRKGMTLKAKTRLSVYTLLPLGACALLALLWFLAFIAPAKKLERSLVEDQVAELYNTVKNVPRSQNVGNLLEQVASDRVACYSQSPLGRTVECLQPYLESVVTIGREHIMSAPDMGAFMRNARLCPISYGACMGEQGDSNRCIAVEAACLEFVYDSFWRGRPFNIEMHKAPAMARKNRLENPPPDDATGITGTARP